MLPDDQPTIPTKPPHPSRSSQPCVWAAPTVEELQAKLPQYEVLEILGRGGMGAVYKARQKSLKRLVAIKILPLGMADDEFKFAERFQNEAQTMAAMNHPAIVAVHDFGETNDGLLYFVMEFVDGTDVHKMIQASGRLSGEYALAITAHVCDALSYAHKRGVIHRDIKPANILIDQEGHIKVADFGLAKMHDPAQTSGLTKTNMAMGTPDYVAPEVLVTGMVPDHRADIYAVGVMLYQMLTGEVPRGMFKLPSDKGVGSDPRFDAIICKAMEQDREDRYQTALEVRRDLDVILTTPQPKNDGTGVVPAKELPQKPVARPLGQANTPEQNPPPSKGAAKQPPAQNPDAAKTKVPSKKQSPAVMWMSIGSIVAVLGVAAFFVLGGKTKPVLGDPSEFAAQVAELAPEKQVELVVKKIVEINGMPVTAKHTIAKGVVTELEITRPTGLIEDVNWKDLSAIAALRGLTKLKLLYLNPSDISFLRGLKIEALTIHSGKFNSDVLRELPLTDVAIRGAISDFSALAGKPIKTLDLKLCQIRDISFVKGMPLTRLVISGTSVKDLSPIRGLPLKEIEGDFIPERDAELLRSIPTLQKINDKPVAEYWVSLGNKASASLKGVTGKTIDLLPLVDVTRDAISGEWKRQPGGLSVAEPPGACALQLPYQPPEEYDFEVEFTSDAAGSNVNQYLSAGGRSFAWKLNAHSIYPPLYGFDLLDGKFCREQTEASTKIQTAIEPGKRYRSTVEVRRGKLRALLDGKELVNWSGDFRRLSMEPITKLRDDSHLGVGSWRRAVTFHKFTVREISGTGKVDAAVTATGQIQAGASAPGGPVIDWINAPPPEAAPYNDDWGLKDGVLTPKAKVGRQFGIMENGSVRVRLRLAPDYPLTDTFGPMLQFDIRHGAVTGMENTTGQFQFQVFVPNRDCKLLYQQRVGKGPNSAPLNLWEGNPKNLTETGNAEVEWEFRANGDEFSAWVDGKMIHTARLDKVRSGYCTMTFLSGMQVTRLETTGLKPTRPTPASANSPSGRTAPSITAGLSDQLKWRDVTDSIREKARAIDGCTVTDGVIRWNGESKKPPAIRVTEPGLTSYAIKVRYSSAAQINVHSNAAGFVYVQSAGSSLSINRWMIGGKQPVTLVPLKALSSSYRTDLPHELTVSVRAAEISAFIDGELVATVNDATLGNGAGEVMITAQSAVQRVEVADFGSGKNTDASTHAFPKIGQWKDVTDDVRKKAREKPDLVVDADAVYVKPDSPAVTMPLDRGAAASMAVRLTHKGDGQVTWHGGENGMIYVLCQRTKTIFHRLPKGASAPTPIEPDVPHPEGFVHTAHHQLLMTQEGSRIAAWLDGRFIGEVRDEAFVRSIPQLYISKYGDVRKVEIAELTVSSSSAQAPPSSTARTFNGHRYEFVSGSFTWPEAKAQAEQRGGHLAVITTAEEHNWAWKTFSDQLPPQPKDKVWTRGWWLGASQTAFEKPWQWVTREPLEFTLWGRTEPSAAINPPRYLWMADANNDQGTSSWSAQNGALRGGFLIEWDNAGVP